MDINHSKNIIYKLSELNKFEDVELIFSLVKKQRNADNYYQAMEVALHPDVVDWLKQHIIDSLKEMKEQNGENTKPSFTVADYNMEIQKMDHIAKFDLTTNDSIAQKHNQLKIALNNFDYEFPDKKTNFQIVKLKYDNDEAYFCFYRGIKKNTKRKKFVAKDSNQFTFYDKTILDVGGNIDFFIIGNYIFILNVTNFEYAFDFRDHINKLRDENLDAITAMPFFDSDYSNGEVFAETCKAFIYSRSLARIQQETLNVLQDQFNKRCDELSIIKKNLPMDPNKQKDYKEKFGAVWDLVEYIDTNNYKVIYKEGDKPKPLIHFFADKIVKSFLTDDFKVAAAYD